MIFTDRKITIRNGKSSINEPVILYRGDFEVSIRFTIMESKFRFKSGVNLVDSEKASFGQLAILAPYGGNVFSEEVKCEDGTVTFTLTKEMIDQLEEVGLYSFQIRLFDYYRESRVSIPPVEFGIEVREPVASEDHDNEVNNAIVGYSIAKVVDPKEENVGDTFNDVGQYNKTNWETGDRITEGKLNKIEDAIDKINQNEKNDVAALDKRVTNNFNILEVNKADQVDLLTERKRIDSLASLKDGSTTGDAELIDGRISVEGTTYTSLGESIREQIKTATGELIGLPYTLINGEFITYSNGVVTPHDTSYNSSDYIELLPGAKYVYLTNINYKGKDFGGLAFYGENKAFLHGYQYDNDTNIKIDVPSGAKYLRFTIRSDSLGKTVVYQECAPDILNNRHDVEFMKNTLFNEIELTVGHPDAYILAGTKVSLVAQSNYNVSAPISVKKGDVLGVVALGYLNSVSIISEILENGGYRVLVASKNSEDIYYTYTVPRDMSICISTGTGVEWRLFRMANAYIYPNDINLDFSIGPGYIRHDTGNNQIDKYTDALRATGYIEVEGYTKLYVRALNYKATDQGGMAFYDENHNYISGVQYTPCVDLVIDVPVNVKYARFTLHADSLCVTISANLKEYVDRTQSSGLNKADSFRYDLGELTPNYYIVYTNGNNVTHTSADYQITDYIELKPGHTSITVTHGKTNTDLSGFAFYDKNKGFIQGVQNSANQINTVDIPENATYIRCTIMASVDGDITSTMNLKNSIYSLNEDVAEIKSKIKEDEISYNYCQIFHKIAGIGDSLMSGEIGAHGPGEATRWIDCYNYSWLSNLCKIIGAEAVHYSSGGRTVKSWLDGFLDVMKAEKVKPSAYFIALGTNDRSYVSLGTEADCDTDAETFYGMYSKIINEVKTFNPNATIFCCSLYFSPSDNTTIQYCNAIKYMADKYGCYYIDFVNAHPEYSQNGNVIREKFIANGHFTTHGYVRVGHEMLQLANEVIYNNSEDLKFMSQHYMDLK
jgi:hypothetical protein